MPKDGENQDQQQNGDGGCLVIVLLHGQELVWQIEWEANLRIREADEEVRRENGSNIDTFSDHAVMRRSLMRRALGRELAVRATLHLGLPIPDAYQRLGKHEHKKQTQHHHRQCMALALPACPTNSNRITIICRGDTHRVYLPVCYTAQVVPESPQAVKRSERTYSCRMRCSVPNWCGILCIRRSMVEHMRRFVAPLMPRLRGQIILHSGSPRSASALLVVALVIMLGPLLCSWLCRSAPDITAMSGRATITAGPIARPAAQVPLPMTPGMPGPAHCMLHHTCSQIGLPLMVVALTLPLFVLMRLCMRTRVPFNLRLAPIPPPPQLLYH